MEKTSEENFISHNSNKPLIRTMEDDLKKIRGGLAGNGNAALSPAVSSPVSRRQTPVSPYVSNSVVFRQASSVPRNLPVGIPSVRKAESQTQSSAALIKKTESTPQSKLSSRQEPPMIKKTEIADQVNSKAKPETQEIKKIDFGVSNKKTQSIKKPWEENEHLSPEARLARQISSVETGTSENSAKFNEDLVMPSPLRSSPPFFSSRPEKPDRQFNPMPSAPSSLSDKNAQIEKSVAVSNDPSFFPGKFIKSFLIFLIIAGLSVGIYYLIKLKPLGDLLTDTVSESFVFSAEEETINADINGNLAEEIKAYFRNDSKQSGIYRLIIKDKAGKKSLKIENFKDSLNIVLPDIVANVLDKDYNLMVFNYPEKNYLRLGLIFKPKKEYDVSVFARNWEQDMYKNLEPIFLENFEEYGAERQFSGNNYNNFNIRYLPLGDENMALNYAIDNEKKFLLIATSKKDMYNLIDKTIKGK